MSTVKRNTGSRTISALAPSAVSHLFALVLMLAGSCLISSQTRAQSPNDAVEAQIDGLVEPQRVVLRFLTTSDFPPFNFYDEDGVLTGFNVDLARAICLELEVTCEILERSWDQLLPSLEKSQADAVIAAHSVTAEALKRVSFTDRYFHTPGRFAGLRRDTGVEATPEGLESKRIAVASGSAHEAFVRQYFRGSRILVFDNADIAREALKAGEVDVVFGDAIGLSFWINGTASEQCCDFKGGAYLEPKFFGDGLAIAVSKDDLRLKADIDNALIEVRSKGRFAELVTRYFPYRLY